jgi:hypothetical protein
MKEKRGASVLISDFVDRGVIFVFEGVLRFISQQSWRFAFSVGVSPDDADVKLDTRALRVEHDNGEDGGLGSSAMEEER